MKIINFYQNEKQLIKGSAAGKREAQKRLFDRYAPKMLGVCRRYVRDLHFAEDVMINGFVKVFQNLESFRFEGSFEGWIRKIMVRECISYLRKQQFVVYDGTLYEETVQKEQAQPESMDADYIELLIDALPEGYRAVFMLYVVEGYKHHEIADLLGVTENTSKSQLFKARKLLQEKLREQNIVGYGTE